VFKPSGSLGWHGICAMFGLAEPPAGSFYNYLVFMCLFDFIFFLVAHKDEL
jgi:hypothetical protein